MDIAQFVRENTFSSPILGTAVTLGNLVIWLGLASAISAVVLYWTAMVQAMRLPAPVAAAGNGADHSGGAGNGITNGKKRGGAVSPAITDAERAVERTGLWARRCYYLTGACAILGAACLMTLMVSQQYAVDYVYKNSNNSLFPGYRFSAFWSDQEGTFFLWALYNTIFGAILLWRARADERWVMPFFTLINVSLFCLLTFMNPFWVRDSHSVRTGLMEAWAQAGQAHGGGSVAELMQVMSFLPHTAAEHLRYYFGWSSYWKIADGQGLNESLQNFWFLIHPPTLFLGYSSMVIPSCFALGALMRRDYDGWVNRAAPWLMFSWTVLATGVFLGGYWAYETLGWGGYWSWDPVENSSLMPWLMGTILLHGLLAQRNRGNFKQANLFVGVMTGAVVLLGSFLVRSGVLQGSVHSFETPQKSVFFTLVAALVIWFAMASAIWGWRFRDVQSEVAYEHVWERHFGFFLGQIALSAVTLVVMIGVFFMPVVLPLFIVAKKNPDFTYYNKALIPIAVLLTLLMAITPLMPWRRARDDDRPMKLFNQIAIGIAAVIAMLFVLAGAWAWMGHFQEHNDFAYVVFGMGIALGLVTNGVCLRRAAKGGITNAGPWLAHIGFLVVMAGVLITSRFNRTWSIQKLDVGVPARDENGQQFMGRDFQFAGQELDPSTGFKDFMLIDMHFPDGSVVRTKPRWFRSRIEKSKDQIMAWPWIRHEGLSDVYIEPSMVDTSGAVAFSELAKQGEPKAGEVQFSNRDPRDQVTIQLLSYDTSSIRGPKADPKSPTLYADFLVTVNGEPQKVRAGMKVGGPEGPTPIPALIHGLHQPTPYFLIFQLDPSGAMTADAQLQPDQNVLQGYFQVVSIPGIQVLWWGVYIMVAGGWLSFARRRKLAGNPGSGAGGAKPEKQPERREADTPAVKRELVGARAVKLRPNPGPAE